MAIKQGIELIGDDIVIRKLTNLKKVASEAFGSLNESLPELKIPIDPKPIEEFTGHTIKLTDAMKVLKPVLQATGTQMKELGSLSRLAANNMVAFGGVVAAGAAVAVVSFSESVALLKQRLADLTGSGDAGAKAFEGLNASAAKLGTTVKAALPGFEGLLTALNTIKAKSGGAVFVGFDPVAAVNIETAQKAYNALFATLRAAGVDTETANKAIAEFNAELRAGGVVTGQMVQKLTDLAPGAGKLLADAFGQGGKSVANMVVALDKVPEAGEKAAQGLARIEPAAEKAFDDRPIKTLGDRATEELARIERAATDAMTKLQTGLVVPPDAQAKMVESFGATGEAAGQAFQAGAIEQIKQTFKAPLPAEAQEELVNRFRETGKQGATAITRELQPALKIPAFDFTVALGSFFELGGRMQDVARLVWQNIQNIFSQPIRFNVDWSSNPFLSGQPTNLAGGGMVRGPGSTTSDSILAFLSNKEFVVNARAVSHYGPELFAALNAMRLPADFIGRFAMGGLARSINGGNKFAQGGQARSGNNVTFVIDRHKFAVTAGDDTVAALKRFSVQSQLSSTGRKPSWVK